MKKKLYKVRGRLFIKPIGIMERMRYFWEQYQNMHHYEPKEIVMSAKEAEELFNRTKGQWKMFWHEQGTPKNQMFFRYRGVKVIIYD